VKDCGKRTSYHPNRTVIDPDLCDGCGLCVVVCPLRSLALRDGKAVVTGKYSLGCDQCAAVCPREAVSTGLVDDNALTLTTIQNDEAWIPYGQFDTAALVRLIRSRRSCRSFSDTPMPRQVLDDLVKIGAMAPSGHNTQTWQFTVLPDRASVGKLALAVGEFFRRLNRLAEKRIARLFARLFLSDVLGDYYRRHYAIVKEGLRQWDEFGRDTLFWGAPAALVMSSQKHPDNSGKDVLLASQNILLAAHAMGYASCFIGFAVNAMAHDRKIARALGIPDDEEVLAVIALGRSDVRYHRVTRRRRVLPRYCFGVTPSA
jgi:nitroreductase/Pyruvate/2-oxoacid:ferredoxin oxidoreductase delta subunit